MIWLSVCVCVFLAFDFCRFCVVIRLCSSPPQRPMTSDFDGFLYQFLSITLYSNLNSWERASISLFNVEALNKGTISTILITSLVFDLGLNPGPPALDARTLPLGYRGGGPWLGIEPGTSRTRCQYSTTRLSRRRCFCSLISMLGVQLYDIAHPNSTTLI